MALGYVGYETTVSLGAPIDNFVIQTGGVNRKAAKNLQKVINPSSDVYVPVYRNSQPIGWVKVCVDPKSPNYGRGNFGYSKLAKLWSDVYFNSPPKMGKPYLVWLEGEPYIWYSKVGNSNLTSLDKVNFKKLGSSKSVLQSYLTKPKGSKGLPWVWRKITVLFSKKVIAPTY